MLLEKQHVSLGLAKELRELGYPQESLFYWRYTQGRNNDSLVYKDKAIDTEFYTHISAPTTAELLEVLVFKGKFHALYETRHGEYTWQVNSNSDQWDTEITFGHTPQDALAEMLIHLLKEKLITL